MSDPHYVSDTFRDGFEKHMAECRRCREQPMSLCEIGVVLLRATVETMPADPLADALRAALEAGKDRP
jgi:hypothetical protein